MRDLLGFRLQNFTDRICLEAEWYLEVHGQFHVELEVPYVGHN